MSKYYDTDAPFSIDNWNLLIEDVNNILQNPPANSNNCQPIDTIQPVTDPHLWSDDDIKEVRNKLMETCPDISFQEELLLWRAEIVDEIEVQMENAWCDCNAVEEPDELEIVLGTFEYTPCNAVMNTTQQGLVEGPISPVCQKVYMEYMYGGPWYPHIDNSELQQTVADTYATAYEAVRLFLIAMNKLPALADAINSYQEQCDYYTSRVDADIARIAADPALQSSLAPGICANGQAASMYQTQVDEQVEQFQLLHQEAMLQAHRADTAAAANSVAALSMVGRFPPDRNILADAVGIIPAWNWYDWWDPQTMDVLSKIFNHEYNSTPLNTQRDGGIHHGKNHCGFHALGLVE